MMVPALMAWVAGYDGGQPAQPSAPQWIRVKPAASGPAAQPEALAAPQDLLTSAPPECRSDRQASPVRGPIASLVGKKVALRGVLIWGPGWSCRCGICGTTLWVVVVPTAPSLDRRPAVLLIERKGELSPWALETRVTDSPDIDVIATGILHHTFQISPDYDDFLLGHAELCRLKADPKRPKMLLHHPPLRVYDMMTRGDIS